MSDAWNNFVAERGTADEWAELQANNPPPAPDADFADRRRERFFEGDDS